VTPKPAPHIIHISSSDVSKVGSIIVIELTDDQQAIRVAQKLAAETGHRVTVRNERFALIETIPAASVHG
jgi:LysM repeat protein